MAAALSYYFVLSLFPALIFIGNHRVIEVDLRGETSLIREYEFG
jgi:hypothetical protein